MPASLTGATASGAQIGTGEPAVSIGQVAGLRAMRFMGGGEGDPGILTLTEDGTFSMNATGGYHKGMSLGVGTYRFEDDVLVLASDQCDGPRGNIRMHGQVSRLCCPG